MHRSDPRLASLNWDDVRLFLALCRARTLGEAARTLGVDASTVSRRLASLEDTLAASLFERGRAGVRATPAAESLMPLAGEIERAMARFAGAAESLEREVEGLVRIACPPDAAEVMLVPHLAKLLTRYPKLRIELQAEEALVDVSRRAADIALRVVRPERGDLIVRTLGEVGWVLAATPELALELGRVRRYADLPWVSFGERYAHIPVARWVEANAKVEPRVRSDSLRVQIAVICSGLCVGLIPSPSVGFYGLVPVPCTAKLRRASPPTPSGPLFLLTHRALRQVPRVRAVWEFLLGLQ